MLIPDTYYVILTKINTLNRATESIIWILVKKAPQYVVQFLKHGLFLTDSLYPYVMREKDLPISHPKIWNSCNFKNNGNYPSISEIRKFFGLIKTKMMFPVGQKIPYFPVLTFRINHKLMFPICR